MRSAERTGETNMLPLPKGRRDIAQSLYLAYYALTLLVSLRNLTMLKTLIPLPSGFNTLLYLSGAAIVLFKMVCEWEEWKGWELAFAGAFLLIAAGISTVYHRPMAISLLLLVLGAHGVDFRRLVLLHLTLSLLVMGALLLLCSQGLVANLVHERGGKLRNSFGYGYPTSFAAHLFFLCCDYLWLRERRAGWAEALLPLGLGWLCYCLCDARTSFLCMTALSVLTLCLRLRYGSAPLPERRGRAPVSLAVCLSMPGFALLNVALSLLYRPDSPLLSMLDRLLSGRLCLGREAFTRYLITPFGQIIGESSIAGKQTFTGATFVIDPSYTRMLFKFGLPFMLLVVLTVVLSCFRERERQNWWHLAILLLLGAHSFVENHLFQPEYHPFLLLLLAETTARSEGLSLPFLKSLRRRSE